jgi:hypothetical protein
MTDYAELRRAVRRFLREMDRTRRHGEAVSLGRDLQREAARIHRSRTTTRITGAGLYQWCPVRRTR